MTRVRLPDGELLDFYNVHLASGFAKRGTPLGGRSGSGVVIDYLFANDRIEVHDAWVTFDRVDDEQPHIVASDHYGLAATISLRP